MNKHCSPFSSIHEVMLFLFLNHLFFTCTWHYSVFLLHEQHQAKKKKSILILIKTAASSQHNCIVHLKQSNHQNTAVCLSLPCLCLGSVPGNDDVSVFHVRQ